MRNIQFKLSTILFVFIVFISHASSTVITERLRNASLKEKGHSASAVFSSKDEIPGYLKGISVQEQSVGSLDDSRLSDKVEVIFYPIDGKSDNIDKSFFIAHNIEYTQSESFLVAYIPKELVPELENVSGAYYADISEPVKPMEVVSEGRDAINATKFVLDGVDGAGVKIAVIDIGFRGYLDLQNRGELPRNLITIDFITNGQQPINSAVGDKHGSVCAEIIYDIAPGAEMYLCKIERNIMAFQNALNWCASSGINIVSCSIGADTPLSFIAGGGDLDNSIDSNNFLSVVAAGNEANRSWFGSFQNSGKNYNLFPNGSEFLNVNVPVGADITLMWDAYYNDDGDSSYDIFVYDQSNKFIGKTGFINNNNSSNVRSVTFNNSRSNRLKISIMQNMDSKMLNGRYMRLIFSQGNLSGDVIENPIDRNPESSLCMPGDARSALTVGAVNVSNYSSGPIAYYSSRGPTRTNSLTGALEVMKPDIVAPTGVTTASRGYRGFAGTSAATPHVAGAAALLLSLSTGTTIAELKDKVIGYAIQIQSSPDNTYGNGKLVLDSNLIPPNNVGDFVCYPNPVSISGKGYVKITNLPFNTSLIEINIYTVTGEFVKSFDVSDLTEEYYTADKRRMVKWDLKNQDGSRIAPGVFFVTVKTIIGKQVKKIAIQK